MTAVIYFHPFPTEFSSLMQSGINAFSNAKNWSKLKIFADDKFK